MSESSDSQQRVPQPVSLAQPEAIKRCPRCGLGLNAGRCPVCPVEITQPQPLKMGWRLFDVLWGTQQVFALPELRPWAFSPVAVSGLVLGFSVWWGFGWFSNWFTTWLQQALAPGVLSSLLQAFVAAFSVLGALVIFGFLFLPVLGLVCMPFFDPLAAKLEARLLGEKRDAVPIKVSLLLREIALLLVLKLILILPALLLLGIPVLGPVLLTAVMAMVLSLDFLDIIWMRKGYSFNDKLKFLKQNFTPWLLYLAPLLVLSWIPLLQLLILPGAAAGAVRFYLNAKK